MTPSNFSEKTPGLALVWDSTSLSDLMFCPERYRLSRIEGWVEDKVDLAFGRFIASGVERYKKGRLRGEDKETASLEALKLVMAMTWQDGQPWGGRYEPQWHCKGEKPYKNSKGNRAKCPYAHKGMWFPEPTPSFCGECGSATETSLNFISEHYSKNRISVARAIIWWCDEQPQDIADGLHPFKFPGGKLAVELFVVAPLPFQTEEGETFLLCGHLDEITEYGDIKAGGELYVLDNKTTGKYLNDAFFESYSPNVQFDTYDILAPAVYPELNISGVMIDAIQVLKDAVRTGKWVYYKSESQREEHLKTIGYWLGEAEKYARTDYWPMNKRNCGFCPFKGICSLPVEEREDALLHSKTLRKQAPWNPLHRRD